MAKSAKLEPKAAQLKKLIAREADTARAAHFRRVMDGTTPLVDLTCKTDQQREQREALIDALPPVKPFVDEAVGANTPGQTGLAALQADMRVLQAQFAKLGG